MDVAIEQPEPTDLGDCSYRRCLRNRVLLAILGILLATVVATLCAQIEDAYMVRRGFFFDPVSYLDRHVFLHDLALRKGRWVASAHELGQGWAPLRTVPLLLINPRWLGERHSHLYTAAPAMAIFLILLGWMLERGPGSLVLGGLRDALLLCGTRLLRPLSWAWRLLAGSPRRVSDWRRGVLFGTIERNQNDPVACGIRCDWIFGRVGKVGDWCIPLPRMCPHPRSWDHSYGNEILDPMADCSQAASGGRCACFCDCRSILRRTL